MKNRKRRIRGSGSVYVQKGRGVLEIKLPITGKRVCTGLEDTSQNRKKLQELLDAGYFEFKFKNINPFEKLTTVNTSIGAAFGLFMETYGASKAKKTQVWYRTSYNKFFSNNNETKLSTKTLQLCLENGLEEYTTKSVSVVTYLRAISVFTNWCLKKKYIIELPDYDYLKQEYVRAESNALPEIYTDEEVQNLLSYFNDNNNIELRLFIELLVNTGLRFHEAVELKQSDVTNSYIKVTSKDGLNEQRFPQNSTTRRILSELTQTHVHGSDKIFSYTTDHDQYKRLLKRLNSALRELGIEKRGRAYHEFRKTFISRLCRNKIPLDVASKIARCKIEVMMMYYRNFSDDELLQSSQIIA